MIAIRRISLLTPIVMFAVVAQQASLDARARRADAFLDRFTAALATQLPPDFAADLLIRLADSKRGTREGWNWREALYEEAFDIAQGASLREKRRILPWGPTVSREGIATIGYGYGLDITSLRARAVVGLFDVNPWRAVELAREVVIAPGPSATCRDTTVSDVTSLAEMYHAVLRFGLSRPAHASRAGEFAERALELLNERIAQLRSSAEAAAVLHALASQDATPERLLAAVGRSLAALAPDDPAFTAYLVPTHLAMKQLVEGLESASSTSAEALLRGYRTYLITNLSGARCSFVVHPHILGNVQVRILAEANTMLRRHHVPPVAIGALTPSRAVPAGVFDELWRGQSSEHLPTASPPMTGVVRVELPGGWSPDVVTFHERSQLLLDTLAAEHDVPIRRQVLKQLLTRLALEDFSAVGVADWFAHVSMLLDRFRPGTQDRGVFLRLVEQTGHPVLQAYAAAQDLVQ
jgi:hypothetical protein